MNILSVDTSSNSACLGLFQLSEDKKILSKFTKSWDKKRSHSEIITKYFQSLLNDSSLSIKDIDLICLGIGPGSFTGIRVALNFAKALAYSNDISIYTINSLLPIVHLNQNLSSNVIVLNNAFRNMIYGLTASTHPITQINEPFACSPSNILDFISLDQLSATPALIGNAVELYKDYFPKEFINKCKISPNALLNDFSTELVSCYLQDKSPELKKWNQVIPLYIRGSEAEEKLKT